MVLGRYRSTETNWDALVWEISFMFQELLRRQRKTSHAVFLTLFMFLICMFLFICFWFNLAIVSVSYPHVPFTKCVQTFFWEKTASSLPFWKRSTIVCTLFSKFPSILEAFHLCLYTFPYFLPYEAHTDVSLQKLMFLLKIMINPVFRWNFCCKACFSVNQTGQFVLCRATTKVTFLLYNVIKNKYTL